MKKALFLLMWAVAAHTTCFANVNDDKTTEAAREVATRVKNAPSGTTYGIVENTKAHVTVSTPLGRYKIEKKDDGSVSFMGLTAKIVSVKNGIYKVKTSLGTFNVNTTKGTITKV